MTKEEIMAYLESEFPDGDFILADGFEEAFIGVATRYGLAPVAMYDHELCIGILMSQGMPRDQACEFFGFHVLGSWNGDRTPMFSMLAPGLLEKILS